MPLRRILTSGTAVTCLLICVGVVHAESTTARLDALFDRLEKHLLFRGAALVGDGEEPLYLTVRGLANEEWGIPNTPATRYRIASLSKQFAAVITLQLVTEGHLSLDDPLAVHLSELPESWSGDVLVRHLLNQTTGIPDYTLLPDYLDTISKQRFSREEFLQLICADSLFATLHFAPGRNWEYSNTNYFLLGVIAETVANVPYEDLLEQRIFSPLGMRDSGVYDSRRPVARLASGYELTYLDDVVRPPHAEFSPKSVPSGGIYSTVYDLLKWSVALRRGDLLAPSMQAVFATPPDLFGDSEGYVCGQWRGFLEGRDGRRIEVFCHGGSIMGMSTWLLRVPAEDICVVLLHNGGSARESMLEKIAEAIWDILDGGEGELPPLDLIGPLASTYLSQREALFDHYHLLKERHREIYDFGPDQLATLGQLLIERAGDRETAASIFRLNVDEHADSPLAHRDLGSLLLEDGIRDEALAHLLRARELSSETDSALDSMISQARLEPARSATDRGAE